MSADGARLALAELRRELSTITYPQPWYRPGSEPTAADACSQLLETVEYAIKQIEIYVGPSERTWPRL